MVPWVIFTDPEITHVGLTEAEARREHGDNVRIASLPFTAVDRAVINREIAGMIKIITSAKPILGHAGGGALLGAHIVGPNAGELIHEFVVGMQVHAFARGARSGGARISLDGHGGAAGCGPTVSCRSSSGRGHAT